ncbi:MAG TPA: hypothetical protein VHW24_04610 [Bryobacteraceae bacterium]|jgi:hypothetical protein|nr:hypothetical protein [Bryobacteraceae bacterium]
MPLFACLLFLTLFRNVNMVDRVDQVPPDNWRYIDSSNWRSPELQWREEPAIVTAVFTVESGAPVRLLMIDRAGLEELKTGHMPSPLRKTPPIRSGVLREHVGNPNDCVFVLENRGSPDSSVVRLRVSIDSWEAAELSPRRKLAVLAISFCVFVGITGYATSKLWRVFKV